MKRKLYGYRSRDFRNGIYVNVYRVSQCYGGPEEGGWWYDAGELVKSVRCKRMRQALRLRDQLRKEYTFNRSSYTSSYSDDDNYSVDVETKEIPYFPERKPRYC